MKSWSICIAGFVLFAVIGSVLRTEPEEVFHAFDTGTVHVSPRLHFGCIGIIEAHRLRSANVRQYQTLFFWGAHFFSLPFRAPIAAFLVATPLMFIAVPLWMHGSRERRTA